MTVNRKKPCRPKTGTYLMVLPVPFYLETHPGGSPLRALLQMLKQQLGGEVSGLVVAGPWLSAERFASGRSSWIEIDKA